MAKPYFPPPGGGEQVGYREAAPKPLDDAPPQVGDEEPAKRAVLVTRPDDPDIARAKAEYGTGRPPAPDVLPWLRPLALVVLILIVGMQIVLALRAVVRPPPRPIPSAAPARTNTWP